MHVLGVNLENGTDLYGTSLLTPLAGKTDHNDVSDGTLSINITIFDGSGCDEVECTGNSAGTSDVGNGYGSHYVNTNASCCEITEDVAEYFEKHLYSIACALGHVANPAKSIKE